MADKHIGALDPAAMVHDDTLFVAEQQGKAVKVTGRQLRELSTGSTGGSTDGSTGGGTGGNTGTGTEYTGGGYVEMTESIPVSQRKPNTLYALVLKTY